MSSEQNQQPPLAPQFCVSGCGFYGNPTTRNMCSKCHREHLQQNQTTETETVSQIPPAREGGGPIAIAAQAYSSPMMSEETLSQPTHPAAPVPTDGYLYVKDTPTAISSSSQRTPEPPEEQQTDHTCDKQAAPKQTNTSRCWQCNKKVGLLGFQCRCGFFFCGDHRYADTHDCVFDYKTFGREQLSKANQKVVAEKLHKI